MDKDNKNPKASSATTDTPARSTESEEIYRKLGMSMRQHKPSPEAIAAAVEAAHRLAAESDAETAAEDTASDSATVICGSCGHRNRKGNKFCGRCGAPASGPGAGERHAENVPGAGETHHYHHHYHHHYFQGGAEGSYPRAGAAEPVREEKMRTNASLRGEMSRAEAGVRSVTQEWMMGCNTKHLDDLIDLYVSDPLVLRSNTPPIRGAAAVREFFFGALDAGLGEVELDPIRVEVVGDLAYEAGRYKALVPSSSGKRREERGKYLWVCARQSNGEWKLASDCWSSDLTMTGLEADVPASTGVKTSPARKSS